VEVVAGSRSSPSLTLSMMDVEVPLAADVVVIGAGPGGLGAAALLTRKGFEVLVLERERSIAPKWRAGYDRLRINTSSWFSYLPGRRFPRKAGRWVSRDELVAYYDDYAASHRLRIRTGVEAKRIEAAGPTGEGWAIETADEGFAARAVVVATGKQDKPAIPDWPGRPNFTGELIHSSAYRNAAPYRGRDVLVVGAGNSGMDIALDLVDGGAGRVWVSVNRAPHIARREVLGLPHDFFGVLSRRSPLRMVDSNAKMLRRLTIGDLSEFGLPIPDDGPVTRLEKDGKVPTVDAGDFVACVRARRISIVAAVAKVEEETVVLADRTRLTPQIVVAATGYQSGLGPLVGHLGLLDDEGMPLVHGPETHPSAPGIHFIGFVDPRSGLLRELRLEAVKVSRALGRQFARKESPQTTEKIATAVGR
jgi:putative flavoprotein involved in K+ transport